MRGLPFAPWFTSDWLASSARLDLTLPQRAIYLDLLFHIWERGGAIPADETKLAKLAMATTEEFQAAWPAVRQHFVPHPGEPEKMLTNEKMFDVIRKQASTSKARSRAGQRGGVASGKTRSKTPAKTNHLESETELETEREKELERDQRRLRDLITKKR